MNTRIGLFDSTSALFWCTLLVGLVCSFFCESIRGQLSPRNSKLGPAATRLPSNIQLLRELTGLNGWAQQIEFSPDGSLILAVSPTNDSRNGAVKIWNVISGKLIRSVVWNSWAANVATFSPDGRFIAVGTGQNGGYEFDDHPEAQVSLLDSSSGNLVRILTASESTAVTALAFIDDNTLVGGTSEGTVEFWETSTGKRRFSRSASFSGEQATINTLRVSPDYSTVAVGRCGGEIGVWQISAWILKQRLKIFSGNGQSGCEDLAFFRNSNVLIAESWLNQNTSATVWDTTAGRLLGTFRNVRPPFAFSPDGRLLATGGLAVGAIRIWTSEGQKLVREVPAHQGAILSLQFSADSKMLVSGSDDRSIKVWVLSSSN